jgi:hypothetical protein
VYFISRGAIYFFLFFSHQEHAAIFPLLVFSIVLLRKTDRRSIRSGSIIEKKENYSSQAIFLMWYLSVGTTLTGRGIVLRTYTWPGDLRLNSYSVVIEPLGGCLLCIYRLGHVKGYFGIQTGHVIVLVERPSRSVDQGIRKFYIRLGRYLLDKSFVLNSDNILIY